MNLVNLSKVIAQASLDSNAGMQGLATAQVGDVLRIKASRDSVTGRTDITEDNPLVIFGAEGKNKEFSINAVALPNLRIVHMDHASADVAVLLKDTQFATGLTQREEFTFLKEFIDNIDSTFDAEKRVITCVGRLNVPDVNLPDSPAMTTMSYNGAAEYGATIRSFTGNDNQAAFQTARQELHESGVKSALKSKNPGEDPAYFVWVPVFKVDHK